MNRDMMRRLNDTPGYRKPDRDCPYHAGIMNHDCRKDECIGCGWNPEIDRVRRNKLRHKEAHGELIAKGETT